MEERVVEMVAELVEKRPEKRLECDHLSPFRREIPDRYHAPPTAVRGRVESLELSAPEWRSAKGHPHADPGHGEGRADVVGDPLSQGLHVVLAPGREHVRQRGNRALQRGSRA